MNTSLYESKPNNHNFGKDIDELLKIRETARFNFAKSKFDLIDLGAKTLVGGKIECLPSLDLEKYSKCSYQEFYWEAEYNDGSVVAQFEGSIHRDYGHINQNNLKIIRWVSNFSAETDAVDKRVIVSLDWKTGLWSFFNGFVTQEVRGILMNGFPEGTTPKLILKMVKRESSTVSLQEGGQGEVTLYKRYILGWEDVEKKIKIIVCVEPNGFIHFWE